MSDLATIKLEVMGELIAQALEDFDEDMLQGLQAFEMLLRNWPTLNTPTSVMSYLIHNTIQIMRRNATEYKDENIFSGDKSNAEFDEELLCSVIGKGRKNIKDILAELIGQGYIDFRDDNATQQRLLFLPRKRWNSYLQKLFDNGEETTIYCEGLGRIIWASTLARQDAKFSGVSNMKPIFTLMDSLGVEDEFTVTDCKDLFRKAGNQGRFYDLLRSDSEKPKNIRLLLKNDGENMHVNLFAKNAYNHICTRADQLMQKQLVK